MKKRKNTPADARAEAVAGAPAMHSVEVVPISEIAGEIPSIAAPKLADTPAARINSPKWREAAEPPSIAPPVRKEPVLPRAATLGPAPASAPRVEPATSERSAGAPAAAASAHPPRRFALLAVCVALCAGFGALGGSLGVAGVGHLLAPVPPPALPVRGDAEEIRALKDSVAQLRVNLKTIGDNVAAVRTGLNASFSSSTAHLAKLTEAVEKLEHQQVERHVAATPTPAAPPPAAAPETTGSIASGPAAKPAGPPVLEGWVLRKAYRGAALVEGRYGIIEIEPGDHLPGVGRVEEIKRQDGRWVVVTMKGLILPPQ